MSSKLVLDLQDNVLTPTLVHSFNYTYGGGLKLGPDSLIYHIFDNGFYSNELKLGRILQPDIKYIPGVTIFNQFYEESFKTYNNVYGVALCEFLVMPTTTSSGIFDETQDSDNTSIYIYPNPTTEIIIVSIPTFSTNNKTILEVYNINGALLNSVPLNANFTEVDVSNLTAGVYFIKITDNDSVTFKKIVKE